jgi:hypothetical protein
LLLSEVLSAVRPAARPSLDHLAAATEYLLHAVDSLPNIPAPDVFVLLEAFLYHTRREDRSLSIPDGLSGTWRQQCMRVVCRLGERVSLIVQDSEETFEHVTVLLFQCLSLVERSCLPSTLDVLLSACHIESRPSSQGLIISSVAHDVVTGPLDVRRRTLIFRRLTLGGLLDAPPTLRARL